jgi:hypothetical protein
MEIGPRLAAYRTDRRGAVASLTADLQRELEGLIVPSGDGEGGGGGEVDGDGGDTTRPPAQPAANRAG